MCFKLPSIFSAFFSGDFSISKTDFSYFFFFLRVDKVKKNKIKIEFAVYVPLYELTRLLTKLRLFARTVMDSRGWRGIALFRILIFFSSILFEMNKHVKICYTRCVSSSHNNRVIFRRQTPSWSVIKRTTMTNDVEHNDCSPFSPWSRGEWYFLNYTEHAGGLWPLERFSDPPQKHPRTLTHTDGRTIKYARFDN